MSNPPGTAIEAGCTQTPDRGSTGGRARLAGPHLTARFQGEAERSQVDEAGGPIAQLVPVPQDVGDDDETDPLAALKADMRSARGKALLLETTNAGWGEGKAAGPQRNWMASRLGPPPPEAMVRVADAAFARTLAACGVPPGMFESNADGTAQHEATRQWHMNTVLPIAKLLEHELGQRLETEVSLRFDSYALDLAGRAQIFQKTRRRRRSGE